jgi:asparagine synthase (glutamine-hydrolysing)
VRDGVLEEGVYWTPPPNAPADPAARVEDHLAQVRNALDDAVRQSLISDVPLGAFLSGGLDSSLIVAMMQQHSRHVVRTFSIGFEGDASFDETRYAQQVAEHLGTQHTAFTVQPRMLDLLPKLVWHHDQPFGDSSAIPTYLVSMLAREHVTVAITGDGGDELFAGYDRFRAAQILTHLQHIPKPLLRAVVGLIDGLPEATGYANRLARARRFLHGALLPQTRAYFDWMRLFSADVSRALVGLAGDVGGDHFVQVASRSGLPGLLDANLITYLPDDLLVKVDRSSMAASLETRAPFLDHLLVEQAARVPFNLKLRGMTSKYLLKTVARAYLPDAIIDRPKHGFGVPLGAWLRRDSSMLHETLLSGQARERGLLDAAAVGGLIDAHVSGQRDHGGRLWALLTLEWWYRLFIDAAPPSAL